MQMTGQASIAKDEPPSGALKRVHSTAARAARPGALDSPGVDDQACLRSRP